MTDVVTLLAGPVLIGLTALAGWGKELVDRRHREQREDQAAARQETLDRQAAFEVQAKDHRDTIRKQYHDVLLILYEQSEAIISMSSPDPTPNESADERYLRINKEIMSRRSGFLVAVTLLRLDLTSRQVVIESLKADQEIVRAVGDQLEWWRERVDKSLPSWPGLDTAAAAMYSAFSSVESAMMNVLEQYQPAFSEVRERMLQQAWVARALSTDTIPPVSPT